MAEYIDRESLIKRFCERCNEEMSESPCEPSDCFAKEVLKTIPAADVAPVRRGRWERVIPSKSAAKWSTKVSCSNCHNAGYTRYKYCPNCGCRMDG